MSDTIGQWNHWSSDYYKQHPISNDAGTGQENDE